MSIALRLKGSPSTWTAAGAAVSAVFSAAPLELTAARRDLGEKLMFRSRDQPFVRLECEHIAALLKSTEEVPPVVASFLGLGAARNGWLVHGSLPGEADLDRERLANAGLDVRGLTTRGQLEIMELDLSLAPDEWARPWSLLLEERLEAGFDALWFTRFPVGPDDGEIAAVLPFEEAWMRSFRGRPVVTLCPYIFGGLSGDARASRLQEVASVHDRIVDLEAATTSGG